MLHSNHLVKKVFVISSPCDPGWSEVEHARYLWTTAPWVIRSRTRTLPLDHCALGDQKSNTHATSGPLRPGWSEVEHARYLWTTAPWVIRSRTRTLPLDHCALGDQKSNTHATSGLLRPSQSSGKIIKFDDNEVAVNQICPNMSQI